MEGFRGEKAYLKDYELEFNYFANIRSATGKRVWGVLWKVSEAKLSMLDMSEGIPTLYTKELIKVFDRHDEEHEAFVYIMTKESRLQMLHQLPSANYLRTVEQGYKYFNLPIAYLVHYVH